MPGKTFLFLLFTCLICQAGLAQAKRIDTVSSANDKLLAIDISLDYDNVLDELGNFLDSLTAPRSNFLLNVSASNEYFTYKTSTVDKIDIKKKLIVSPSVGYYHKSGPGISFSANGVVSGGGQGLNLFQYVVTPSFDFIQNRKWTAGIS